MGGEHRVVIDLPDPAATEDLGRRLAARLAAGDALLLEGELGAGKTTLARALIRHRAGCPIEVPSPTFNLVLPYELPGLTIWHFDLYRLSGAAEVAELGFDEALESGAALVEWPDRLEGLAGDAALWIRLAIVDGGRRATLSGPKRTMERFDVT